MIAPLRPGVALPQANGPVIETERLLLRQWQGRDMAPYTAMLSDPGTARFITVDGKGWRDWRVLVSGGRAVAAMIRHGSQWITNVRQGARCERVVAKGDLADIAIAAARAVGAHYAGVDLIRDADGHWLGLEGNSMPAWKGLQGVTPFRIAPRLAVDALGLLAPGRKRTRGRAA